MKLISKRKSREQTYDGSIERKYLRKGRRGGIKDHN